MPLTSWGMPGVGIESTSFRNGCPHEELAAGGFEWLQLLTHPEIWAYPGETMRETMLAMLETERERDLARLAEDRIDLT